MPMARANVLSDYYAAKFPFKPKHRRTEAELNAIADKLGWWELVNLLLPVVFLLISMFTLGPLLYSLYGVPMRHSVGADTRLILISSGAFYFPAFFISVAIGMIATELTLRLLMGEEKYEDYTDYNGAKLGYDNKKSAAHFTKIMLVISGVFMLAMGSSFISYNREYFKIKQYYNLSPTVVPISSITKIARYDYLHRGKHDNWHEKHYKIYLEGGDVLDSRDWPTEMDTAKSIVYGLSALTYPVDTSE
jgi:hypothetical protein